MATELAKKEETKVAADEGSPDEHEGGEFHTKGEAKKDFVPSVGLSTPEAEKLLQEFGKNELEEKTTPKWLIFVQQLYQPMPIMIWIAALVEAVIQNWIDFGILMGIQFANATLGWYETTKAGDAVAALKASLKPTATVKRDGKWQQTDASLLVPGDLVLLGSGSAVPADCLINHGQVEVDQAALTGESLPVTLYAGESAKMGSTVVRGETEATVEFTGKSTFFGKTATMLQQGNELGHLQKILLKIMFVLVGASFILCFTAMGYLLGMGESFVEALEFTVVLLVASIPIAIEIVCTTTLALGSRQLSSHGAIVTRLAAIEDMAGMNMLCSDKTGTLTLNKMAIQDETPTFVPNVDQAELLRMAALAAKWHEPARDALDTLVLGCADLPSLDVYKQIDYMPFDPTVKRTEGTLQGADGKVFKTTKGAPNIILKLIQEPMTVAACEAQVTALGKRGIRCLAVARSEPGDDAASVGEWKLLGLLTFLDPPRPDTKETIHRAMAFGVDVKMITGDHVLIAKETARMLGMGTQIRDAKGLPSMDADGKVPKDLGKNFGAQIVDADGFAQVYPEHKYLIVEALRQSGFAVGMTGDGVNDAPALKRADVGVAVQGATDAARAAADIVLTQPGLSTVVEAIIIARCIFQRMKNFINYRIAATLQLLTFFFIAVLTLHPHEYAPAGPEGEEWPEFFKMPVIMLMLITLLNDGTLISIGYDHVKPSAYPEKWNLKALFCISIILGAVACGSSLLLLWAALDSWNPDGIFHKWGIGAMPYGKITTMVYLKVSVSDFLTLFSARTHEGFFWSSKPSWILMGAATFALTLSTILACVWPNGNTDKIPTEGLAYEDYTLMPLWIWIYCIVWWFIQDALKVIAYWLMHKFNIFNINSDKVVNMRAADSVTDAPLAPQAVGLVETKLLQLQVEDAIHKVEQVSRKSQDPTLARVSANLQLVRNSARLARTSLGAVPRRASGTGGTSGMEEGEASTGVIKEQVKALEQAANVIGGKDGAEIQVVLNDVKQTAEKLNIARTSAAVKK
mmetsp:Transcript_34189/g.75828  ORF Transcript_34189/g.75828 Transcript_34189/m.75828 type:complete len:1030 (+) Transcript_34189:195-3284(+)|eukprot:CAMPEP_0202899856 /NCGR_PEP_ID=MMETSP1392-20130828/8983_1 /ASSEMBLY_ACC=CAM_ASM_000868 /TAXON_ID=225041 /ORGANISM="Chlamydomonas chlamydogama, Strain SAG 11-48b" /LENGTH=1029 /DNA_ID=CAMNT_0049586145 /DNA_START=195 /DNA_END=3284 /DNA_ORIENTATION=+